MTTTSPALSEQNKTPILLLKTRSTPNDGYEEQFSDGTFTPTFVPVLEHKLLDDGLNIVRELLQKKEIGKEEGCKYGGIIFTSQRAVEAFAMLVSEGQIQDKQFPYLEDVPIYTVGPATSRALSSIPTPVPLQIFGRETGNGEALAHHILQHYPSYHSPNSAPPLPLLFLVGEQRRDIIPRTLTSTKKPIKVDEITVYGTGVMESFGQDFESVLERTEIWERMTRWVVVFSPTGCEAMLRCLGILDVETGKAKMVREGNGYEKGKGKTYIATIGPTTRDFLKEKFGFEANVCAERPSPYGVEEAIRVFMEEKGV